MSERHIVAMGGGAVRHDDPIYRFIFELAGAARPEVLFVPTAIGRRRPRAVRQRSTGAFPAHSFEPRDLALFDRTVEDLRVVRADPGRRARAAAATPRTCWRSGGSHGLDEILREAWEAGVVLAGGSAGANCWFEASHHRLVPDRAGRPAARRARVRAGQLLSPLRLRAGPPPAFQRLVGDGVLPAGHRVRRPRGGAPRGRPSRRGARVGSAARAPYRVAPGRRRAASSRRRSRSRLLGSRA